MRWRCRSLRVHAMETNHTEHWKEALEAITPDSPFWRHARNPCNLGHFSHANASAVGVGSCGDKIRVELNVRDGILTEVKHTPQGCVYTAACASAMSVLATGRSLDEGLKLQPEDVVDELGGLPDDHLHCARLAINTLGEAIADYYHRLSTMDRKHKEEKLSLQNGED